MRTKTTILSAVALAAGILTSEAQVYSANVVGYYNIVTPLGNPGSSKKHLISNQLKGGQGGTNGISDVLVAGLGDLNSEKVNLLKWNGAGFTTYTYFGPSAVGNATGAYADGDGNVVNVPLAQGDAAFLENFSGVAITNTVVGEVVQGPYVKGITVGKAPYAIVVPVSTNLLAPFVNLAFGDALSEKINFLHYNVGLQKFDGALTYFGPSAVGNATGEWADGDGNIQTTNPTYYPAVGEGFFIDLYGGAPAYNWTSAFTVQ